MIVALEGNIASGKSTVLQAIDYVFKQKGIDVACHPEPVEDWAECLQKFYTDMARWSFAVQMKILLTHVRRKPKEDKLNIYERSPLASRDVFSQVSFNCGTLTEREWTLYKQYHDSVGWLPDVIIYLKCDPEICFARLHKRSRSCEQTVTLEYLQKLNFHYTNLVKYFSGPVITIDTTHKTPIEVCAEVVNFLCDHISHAEHSLTNGFVGPPNSPRGDSASIHENAQASDQVLSDNVG